MPVDANDFYPINGRVFLMSAVVVAKGQIRTIREMRKRAVPGAGPGAVWGLGVTILTEVEGFLGETLSVTVFIGDYDKARAEVGAEVCWIVEVSVNNFGLNAVFRAVSDVALVGAGK